MSSPTIADLTDDPHAVFAELRVDTPVAWIDSLDGWVVLTHELCVQVMRDAATFTVDDPRFTTRQVVGSSMLSLDGSEHRRHRTPFRDAFRRNNAVLDAFVTSAARELVAGLPAGTVDLRATVAAPLAVAVVLEILGIDHRDGDVILELYRDIVREVERLSAGVPADGTGRNAMEELRKRVLGAHETSVIADAREALSNDEVVSNAAVIMFGGIETSEAMTANAIWHVLTADERSSDRSWIDGAVEESLRLEPAATRVDRYATRNVHLGGAQIAAGDLVIASLAAANRDPAVFPDPDRFDPHRANARQHLAFAQGPHSCIGTHPARAQTRAVLAELLTRFSEVTLTPGSPPPSGLVFRKPDRVLATLP